MMYVGSGKHALRGLAVTTVRKGGIILHQSLIGRPRAGMSVRIALEKGRRC